MTKFFLLTSMLFTLIGCHLNFCSWERGYTQLTSKPKAYEIPGIYILDNRSVKYLTGKGYEVDSCILRLNSDGRFLLRSAPALVFSSFVETDNTYETKNGKWSVSCSAESGCLIELEGICVEPFWERQGKFAISITIGDPDECNGIIFEKQSEQLATIPNNTIPNP